MLGLRSHSAYSKSQNCNLSNSYDIIGDIAIMRSLSNFSSISKEIENFSHSIMKSNKNIRTVLLQLGSISGSFRIRKLIYVLGEKKTYTIHKESNCLFSVDVDKCYFSPRLSYERSRIVKEVKPNERIMNMFSGVGCFSILIAKRVESAKIYSIDINPVAIYFMEKNIHLNRVYNKVVPLVGDAKTLLENKFQRMADRVLMPLPEKAFEYLTSALLSLKKSGGWIHYYDFEYAKNNENPVAKTIIKVSKKLRNLGVHFDIPTSRIVRSIGPNWYQVVLDLKILDTPDSF
jgi:tRNA (guanine37-N1)-methyltransferase